MTITDFFSQNGPLSQAFDSYETRDGQVLLSRHIAKVFRDGGVGLFEAGTGIGKSMAYLYPAYLRSKEVAKPVIISTTTNNLLSQLLYKDLPMLNDVLSKQGHELKFIGIKGKSHYACLAKMDANEDINMHEIIEDLEKTPNGERSELNYQIYDDDWRKINYDRENCAGLKCPFFKDCFITNIKKKAEKANIIVTNHNIIFAEKLAKFQILPDYDDLILDEGHNIESIATDYLTQTISLSQIGALSKDIFLNDGKGQSGLALLSRLKNYSDDLIQVSVNLMQIRNNLYDYLKDTVAVTSSHNVRVQNFEPLQTSTDGEFIIEDRKDFLDHLSELKKTCERIIDLLSGIELENEKHMLMISTAQNYAVEFILWINSIQDPGLLLWGKQKNDEFYIHETPINIGDLLHKELYEKMHSTIIVSATLTVNKNFDYMRKRLGIYNNANDEDSKDILIVKSVFKSPFNYDDQMEVKIRHDIPDQKSEDYLEKIADAIYESVKLTKGNAFVLFTSYSAMKTIAEMLEDDLKSLEIPLLVQESGNREEILKNFRDGGAVLMGVESFWEGVDIPGDALSHVIIVKLPFKVPTSPIEKARADEIEKNGGNSFYDLSLPQAVIKFRQGIGRLIRTQDDKGIITILDPRIVNSGYGKIFMNEIK